VRDGPGWAATRSGRFVFKAPTGERLRCGGCWSRSKRKSGAA